MPRLPLELELDHAADRKATGYRNTVCCTIIQTSRSKQSRLKILEGPFATVFPTSFVFDTIVHKFRLRAWSMKMG